MRARGVQTRFTPESSAKATATRLRKREEAKALQLLPELEFVRSKYWEIAARLVGVDRLPDWAEPMSVTRMTEWLNRLGLSRDDAAVYLSNDEKLQSVDPTPKFSPSQFIRDNPRWPLRAFVGTVIENCLGTWIDSKTFRVDRPIPAKGA